MTALALVGANAATMTMTPKMSRDIPARRLRLPARGGDSCWFTVYGTHLVRYSLGLQYRAPGRGDMGSLTSARHASPCPPCAKNPLGPRTDRPLATPRTVTSGRYVTRRPPFRQDQSVGSPIELSRSSAAAEPAIQSYLRIEATAARTRRTCSSHDHAGAAARAPARKSLRGDRPTRGPRGAARSASTSPGG